MHIVAAAAHLVEVPLPEAFVAVCDVDPAGLDALDWVLLRAIEPVVAVGEDVGVNLRDSLVFVAWRKGIGMMGWDETHIVVWGDEGVDGAGAFDEVSREIFLVGVFWSPVLVALVLEDGCERVNDVVAVVLGQSTSVRGIVDVVPVDVVVVDVDVIVDVEVRVDIVCGANGGGDREGDDGGEEDELHVGLSV